MTDGTEPLDRAPAIPNTVFGQNIVFGEASGTQPAEDVLLKAGALQNAIFNSANFSSIATDARGVIQIFNVGAERMLGYTAAEVLNRITPADISDPQELIERARSLSLELSTPISPGFEALVFKASREIEDIYELTYIRKDGSRFPAVVSVTALRDEQNAIIGFLLIGTDNTARKLVEAEQKKLDQRLRDQQFYTRSLIESNVDALMATDPAGIITDVNKQMEALTGCTRDELIGAPFKDFFTDPERAAAAIKLVLRDKKVTDYELTARDRDGRQTVVSYNATTFHDRGRNLQGVFAAARDVTERKQVEAELKQAKAAAESASRTKSDFLASMSHEIRTPMNSIMGIADLLAKTELSAEQEKYVRIFQRSGENLLNLINDILDLSKVEASQLELEKTGFSMHDHLEKLSEMVQPRAQEKGLTLSITVAQDVPMELIGDPTRLRQVLLNLLGNAIKFTITGHVALDVTAQPGTGSSPVLLFTVTDTGIGIAVEKLEGVFERFNQADTSTTRRFGGSGLGLTICRQLVELMDGQIWVESELGKGSMFAIRVPFDVWNAADHPAVEPVDADLNQALPAMRILLAEDSPDNCTIILAYLEHTPYVVEIGGTGAMVCDMFRAGHYDLVLMDRQMPVMDGLTATRTIRAWEAEHGRVPTPIIALTASALKGDREMCLSAGCSAFLTKPIKQSVLLHAIRECRNPVQPDPGPGDDKAIPTARSPVKTSMITRFLFRCRANVATMQAGLDHADFGPVTRLGHQLCGAGGMFGFDRLTEIGAGLEQAGSSANDAGSREWLGAMAACLNEIEINQDI
jgi:PAS domain S-box-containing protein